MDTTTINVLVNVPKSYSIELLKEQLTAYAQQLISAAKPAAKAKGRYRHEALCGIFNSSLSRIIFRRSINYEGVSNISVPYKTNVTLLSLSIFVTIVMLIPRR